jgi:hypothetical protein
MLFASLSAQAAALSLASSAFARGIMMSKAGLERRF